MSRQSLRRPSLSVSTRSYRLIVEPLEDRTLLALNFLGDINSFPTGLEPREPTVIGKTLFFSADDGISGRELWKFDLSTGTAGLVADIVPGPGGSEPVGLANVGGMLMFGADVPGLGLELWKSDGTAAGTVLVKDIYPGPVSGLSLNNFLFG